MLMITLALAILSANNIGLFGRGSYVRQSTMISFRSFYYYTEEQEQQQIETTSISATAVYLHSNNASSLSSKQPWDVKEEEEEQEQAEESLSSLRVNNGTSSSLRVKNTSKTEKKEEDKDRSTQRVDYDHNAVLRMPQTHPTHQDPTSPYAYVFLLANVDPDNNIYKGMYWHVLVSTHIMQQCHTAADVVVLVQMSANSTYEELPPEVAQPLHDLNIHVRYLPKPITDNFVMIQFAKIHVLALTNYRRVLYMDCDLMPFCHLDYLMELSDQTNTKVPTLLKDNVVHAGLKTPLNGGMMVLAPQPGDFDKIQNIIQKQQRRDKDLPPPHFNTKYGWGHVIAKNDSHIFAHKNDSGTLWDFYAAEVDQGLFYYWTKYYKKSVSIITMRGVYNWGRRPRRQRRRHSNNIIIKRRSNPNNTNHSNTVARSANATHNSGQQQQKQAKDEENNYELVLERSWSEDDNFLPNYSTHPKWPSRVKLWRTQFFGWGVVPWRDFYHMWGPLKPWLRKELPPMINNETESTNAFQYWFYVLRYLNDKLSLGIQFDKNNQWNYYSNMFETNNLTSVTHDALAAFHQSSSASSQ